MFNTPSFMYTYVQTYTSQFNFLYSSEQIIISFVFKRISIAPSAFFMILFPNINYIAHKQRIPLMSIAVNYGSHERGFIYSNFSGAHLGHT